MMRELYAPLNAPIFVTDVRTAEMIKYTANAFLATRISFVNEIANICDRVGADIKNVVAGAGADKRIGTAFMNAGLGFGGSCFPKDVTALSRIAESYGIEASILESVIAVNRRQIVRTAQRIRDALDGLRGRRIAVLGASFKPNTDDIRESPALALAEFLVQSDASVSISDPVALPLVRNTPLGSRLDLADTTESAAAGADALVIATEWNEFKQLDLAAVRALMAGDLLVDCRNLYDAAAANAAGLRYLGIGRGSYAPVGGGARVDSRVSQPQG
jgi:UDPglucose 6-dehydrogenase